MKLTIINDTHCGAIRSGGTTPASSWLLRQHTLQSFEDLLDRIDTDLLINGDLLDTYSIPMRDLLQVYMALTKWLARTGCRLYLAAGNHDLSKNAQQMSSFQMLCELLLQLSPNGGVVPIFKPTILMDHDAYVIPHMPNQELFNLAIEQVPDVKYLFLHCNVENKFAMQADHSLNLSLDQARALKVDHIIVAHEHQRTEHLKGKIQVVGNQIPTSIADCLGNADKWYVSVGDGKLEFHHAWSAEGDFDRQDWRSLADTGARFIRVEGEATAAEAAAVVSAISKFRSKAEALVITNAVKVEGQGDTETLQLGGEEVKAFDVLGAVYELLSPAEGAIVKKLLEGNKHVQTSTT